MFTPQYSCMEEEQQIPNPVESKDKSGTDPEELAYQKMYEKYLKQKKGMNIIWRIRGDWMS